MDDCGRVAVPLCDCARRLLIGNVGGGKEKKRKGTGAGKRRREKFVESENENRGAKVVVHYMCKAETKAFKTVKKDILPLKFIKNALTRKTIPIFV